jgi:hypothetical protein
MTPYIHRFIVKLEHAVDIVRPWLTNNTKSFHNMWLVKYLRHMLFASSRN